jgi:glutamyl-Q tRNA(Asp) synthetase
VGDFVLLRADGLFAYQLAVVLDDADQEISHVVRGADLLDSTPRQIWLQQCLGVPTPEYAHLPVAVNAAGEKLSKQTLAEPLDDDNPVPSLWLALDFLGQRPPRTLREGQLADLWQWAMLNWSLTQVPRQRTQHMSAPLS